MAQESRGLSGMYLVKIDGSDEYAEFHTYGIAARYAEILNGWNPDCEARVTRRED